MRRLIPIAIGILAVACAYIFAAPSWACSVHAGPCRAILSSGTPFYQTPNITPAGLTFSVVNTPVNQVDFFNTKFAIDPLDNFQAGLGAYSQQTLSGSPTFSTSASGAIIGGSATGQGQLLSKLQPLAPYMQAVCAINSLTNAQPYSIIWDNSNNFAQLVFNGTSTVTLQSKVNGTLESTDMTYTPSGSYTLKLVIQWPELQGWITDNNGTHLLGWHVFAATATDLRLQAQFQSAWKAGCGAQSATNAAWSATFSSFNSSYNGCLGVQGFKPIVYQNGAPLVANNKLYLSTICQNGSSFQATEEGVISVNLSTFAVQMEALLFFNINTASPTISPVTPNMTTALDAGGIVYNQGTFTMFVSGWGYGTVTSAQGVQIWDAATTTNLTSGFPVVFSNAFQLALPSSASASYYDNSQYADKTGTWHTVTAQTNALSNWTVFQGSLLTGPSMASLSFVHTLANSGEGPNWTQVGGVKYITASSSVSAPYYDAGLLGRIGTLTADYTTYPPSGAPNPGAHWPLVPISYGPQTRYLLIYFDSTTITPVVFNTALWAPKIVIEGSQLVPGNEHYNFLLNRDLAPSSNDNAPMYLAVVG